MCVERADLNSPPPVEGTHFAFDFTDPDNPDVKFQTGHSTNPWSVWSQVSASDTTPANLGDLFIDSTGSTDNYKVEIRNPNNGNAGAVNLLSAVLLDDTGWSGYSSITDGAITGDLGSGGLTVIQTGGSGGDVDFIIGGDVTGDIVAPVITGTLWLTGDLVSSDITVSDKLEGGLLRVSGDVTSGSVIEVADMVSDGPVHSELSFGGSTEAGFAGRLDLLNGVPSNQNLRFWDPFTGTMDLKTKPYKGTLYLMEGGSGDIINGGALDSLAFSLAQGVAFPGSFSGTASFASVASGTNISMGYTDLAGRGGTDGVPLLLSSALHPWMRPTA